MALPNIMIAPNGARHLKSDHPNVPLTLAEITKTAKACYAAGADGLHLHLRNADGRHILDSGLYREAQKELAAVVPAMAVQITTEAVGLYNPDHQIEVALQSGAQLVSVSVRELTQGMSTKTISKFYQTAADQGIHVQHILYDPQDFAILKSVLPEDLFQHSDLQMIFVLGQYGKKDSSNPRLLTPFLAKLERAGIKPDWAACAFGKNETQCLKQAHIKGGKIRIGFENSFWNADGSIAQDNAERLNDLRCALLG